MDPIFLDPTFFGTPIGFSGKFELAIRRSVVCIAQPVSPNVALLAKLVGINKNLSASKLHVG